MSELDEIIDGGYCVGCGACTSVSKGQIGVVENKYRQYQADLSRVSDESVIKDALAVCPFSSKEPNEDQISRQVFNYSEGHYADVIGYYRSLHAGFVEEGEYRDKCNSGGIITWMLTQLLENDCVDAVIHVQKNHQRRGPFLNTVYQQIHRKFFLGQNPDTIQWKFRRLWNMCEVMTSVMFLLAFPVLSKPSVALRV